MERNATEILELERELERRVLWNDSCSGLSLLTEFIFVIDQSTSERRSSELRSERRSPFAERWTERHIYFWTERWIERGQIFYWTLAERYVQAVFISFFLNTDLTKKFINP